MSIKVRSGAVFTLKWIFTISTLFTLVFLVTGQNQLVIAWWLMLACMLIPVLWVGHSKFLSVKVFVWVAFITQAVTMPIFYLFPKAYASQTHRPFGFTGLEVLQVEIRLGAFLLVFLTIVSFLRRFIKHPSSLAIANKPSSLNVVLKILPRVSKLGSFIRTALILIIILMAIPLNLWMFKMGVGITGIEPPRLPYRLSGILYYTVRWILPGILALLYFQTRQKSVLLVLILVSYGLFLGVSTASRSAVVSLIIVPIVLAFLNRRWVLFSIAFTLGLISVGLTTASRAVIHVASIGKSDADTSLGVLVTMFEAAPLMDWSKLLLILPAIIARLTSFEGLYLASQVDPSSFGGGFAVWLKSLHWRLADLSHEAVHWEHVGYVPPVGFYNAIADTYGYAFWGGNGMVVYYIFFALSSALFLMLQEQSIGRLANKFGLVGFLSTSLTVFLSIFFIIGPGFPQFVNIFFILLISSIFAHPRLNFSRRSIE